MGFLFSLHITVLFADILLVKTMSCVILTQSVSRNLPEYRIRDLKSLLQKRYGYSQGILTNDQLLQLLMDRLRNSGL